MIKQQAELKKSRLFLFSTRTFPLDTYTFIPFLRKKSVGLSPYCSL